MEAGKLTNEQLTNLVLNKLPKISGTSNTIVGANIGSDCAWIKIGDKMMVTSSDPITAGGMKSGTLSIHVSCNDIAACGVKPDGILLVIIAPLSATEEQLTEIVTQASTEASKLGVEIVGGHTEVSSSVNTFVVTTTAFGIIDKDHPVPLGKAQSGDKLIMTKTCGIEGTYITANEFEHLLHNANVSEDLISEAKEYSKLISVVPEGSIVGNISSSTGKVNDLGFKLAATNLLHDITEGGVLGASYEMAYFSDLGVKVYEDNVPITKATEDICKAAKLNPLRLISSGSLMLATPEPELIISELNKNGITATVIGEFTSDKKYTIVDKDGDERELTPPEADEIYKLGS